jgi:hypothetical protein
MKVSSIERALEAMGTMQKGRPYSLKVDDPKRRLVDELKRVCDGLGIAPLVIGGLAVNHHGYARFTQDVDLLVSREDAGRLLARLKSTAGWRRYGEGFKNTVLGVAVDICVEGDRTAPGEDERFPAPGELRRISVRPLPVPALAEVLALKAMSGRARDEADVVELLKRNPRRIPALRRSASARVRTAAARARLSAWTARAQDELARRP